MTLKIALLAAIVAPALAAAPASAARLTSLYSTGVDSAGVSTQGNGADLHWTLDNAAPAYTGGSNGTFPIGPWVPDTASSRWITPTQNAGDGNASTFFTYTTTFNVAAQGVGNAQFSGSFAADDQVTAIVLNGVTISAPGGGYSFRTGFNSTGGTFVAGTNTLSFVTLNSGGGPTGLNVDLSGTAAVPEAATWVLMIAGFGLVGIAARRRTATVAA
ncbi:MAG: PEP-CTERM sorting domain-containing protein [Sphingomonadaceae bacterium]|nr:PEP-CTERM sorting domain-containing protein [Sphingomonadaceae bacterium]